MDLSLPDLPSDFRWVVSEDSDGDLLVRLEERIVRTKRRWFCEDEKIVNWVRRKTNYATNMYNTVPHSQLAGKVEATARELWKSYEADLKRKEVKSSIVGVYNDLTYRDDL